MKIIVFDSMNNNYDLYVEKFNSKLGNIDNFSVKKGVDAYCNKNCNKCYCEHMKMYGTHVEHVQSNFNAIDDSENDPVLYMNICDALINYIRLNGCSVFRFNVEGDISSNYLNIIMEVAKNSKGCVVYLYTKNYDIIRNNIHNIECITNFTVLLSIMNYNDSYIIDEFKQYNNIKFYITARNEHERLTYYKTYHFNFKSCKNDADKNIKCKGCRLCFNNESKFIFNKYRNIKKVKKEVIPHIDLFLKTLNRFQRNNFLHNALKEALTTIFISTTCTRKELKNLNKLVNIKIRSISNNAKREYGSCKKVNEFYSITINNMDYYKTICTLIHELLHVLVYNDGHIGKFKKYKQEIEENTIFCVSGKLNDINYKNSLTIQNEVKEMSQYFVKTRILTEFSYYDFTKTTKNELITLGTNYYCNGKNNDPYYNYVNVRSLAMKSIREYINNEFIDIAKNNN